MRRKGFRTFINVLVFGCQLFVIVASGVLVVFFMCTVLGRNFPPSTFFDYVAYVIVAAFVLFAAIYRWHEIFSRRRTGYRRHF